MGTVRVSNDDGQTFYYVDDSPDSIQAAQDKGYSQYVDVTHPDKGTFTIPKDDLNTAIDKGYRLGGSFQISPPENTDEDQSSALESASSGLASGLTLGAAPKITPVMQGAGEAGISQAFKMLAAPENRPQDIPELSRDFSDNYVAARDAEKSRIEAAKAANPGIYGTANVVGSALTASKLPGVISGAAPEVAATAAKVVPRIIQTPLAQGAMGAVQGYNASEGDTVADKAKDALISGTLTAGVIAPFSAAASLGRGALRKIGEQAVAEAAGAESVQALIQKTKTLEELAKQSKGGFGQYIKEEAKQAAEQVPSKAEQAAEILRAVAKSTGKTVAEMPAAFVRKLSETIAGLPGPKDEDK